MGQTNEKSDKRKPRSVPKGRSASFGAMEYVRYELSADEKQRLRNAAETLPGVEETLAAFLDEGYTVTVRTDDYWACTAVTLRQVDQKGPNGGWLLTGRGSTVRAALLEIFYKHFVLFDTVWPKDLPEARVRLAWDEELPG